MKQAHGERGQYSACGLDVKTTSLDLTIPPIIFALGLGLGMAPLTHRHFK